MRAGIDYTAAVRQRAGIGRYTRNLIRALSELDQENQYRLFVAGGWGSGDGLGALPSNFEVRGIPLSDHWLHILWQRMRVPIPVQLVTGALDLFHSPDFVLPPTGRTPTIVTVHDLSFLRVPECFVPGFSDYLEGAVSRAVSRAAHILADSESTRQDLLDLMNVAPEQVTVLYPGVETRFRPVRGRRALDRVRRRYRLPERFILSVGTIQPRKNLVALVDAFDRLVAQHSSDPGIARLNLVLVGEKGWMFEETFAAVTSRGLEQRVHFPGFVEDSDLPTLYSLASAFAFPTKYEGFGLPVLEAMACGTPVVAADNSSIPEVVADAGLLVQADDPQVLADSLAVLLSDEALRRRLVTEGRQQARNFSWMAAARTLQGVYECVERGSAAVSPSHSHHTTPHHPMKNG